MDWKVEVQTQAEHDLTLILDHLIEAYQSFGDDLREAFDRASHRVLAIRDSALALGSVPYRGTKREEFGPEIRNVTVNRAVIWFDLDAEQQTVRILAFFFGDQDHQRHMLKRLLDRD